tara:strand:- start:1846 stop:2115 length:270 start_codon:yes stop_codon:yes gene_type:complete
MGREEAGLDKEDLDSVMKIPAETSETPYSPKNSRSLEEKPTKKVGFYQSGELTRLVGNEFPLTGQDQMHSHRRSNASALSTHYILIQVH